MAQEGARGQATSGMHEAAWWRSSSGLGRADPKAFPVARRLMDDLKEKVSAYMSSESI